MKKAMAGLLEPTFKEVRLGVAEVRDIFKVPKFGTIAGCMVTEGRITRAGDTQARLLRDNVVVYEGKIGSLRRFKDDVSEVKTGFECGIGFERFNDLKVGDVIEVFAMERVAAPRSDDGRRACRRAARPDASRSRTSAWSARSRIARSSTSRREVEHQDSGSGRPGVVTVADTPMRAARRRDRRSSRLIADESSS